MAKKKSNIDQQFSNKLNEIREEKALLEDIEKINKSISSDISTFLSTKKKIREVDNEINDLAHQLNELGKINGAQNTNEYKDLQKQLTNRQRIASSIKSSLTTQNLLLATSNTLLAKNNSFLESQSLTFKGILGYFNDADKSVRKLNLSLGVSGVFFDGIRTSIFNAASDVAKLGVSVSDLTNIYSAYVNETGRLVTLSESNLNAISEMAMGTTMGAEQAAMMAGQFEIIGKSANQTRDFYESLVNSSERFGINSSKVIKLVNDNFKKSQQYVFKGGVKGLGDMAKFAEKFKVDMTGTFSAIDKARGLEGAVDMAAQLQVIGGEFAKTDPFRLLFLARNDAEGFAKQMQSLTKNLTTFNKETGEFDIAAGNLDRLRLAAEATGMPLESLIEQAKRGATINMAEGMLGGIDKDNKDFITSIAQIQKGGKIVVTMPDGKVKDIRELTNEQITLLKAQETTLKERAKISQSFDEQLTNTINSLKATLLPTLQIFSRAVDFLAKNSWILYGAASLLAGVGMINWVAKFAGSVKELISLSKLGGATQSITNNLPGAGGGSATMNPKQISSVGDAASSSAKGMLAFGAAILMVGGAISISALAISKLVESFKGLTNEQAQAAMGTTIALMSGFAVTIGILALAAPLLGGAAIPLLAFGGAVALIGAGVGIAALGIGYLIKSFGGLIGSLGTLASPDILMGLTTLALTLPAIALGMTALGNPLALLGAYALVKTFTALSEVKGIDSLGSNFNNLSNAVARIDTDKLDKIKETANAISEMDSLSNNIFGKISDLFSDQVVEMKFADNKVDLQIDITNTIDGSQLGSKISRTVQLALENVKKEGSTRST